MSVNRSNRKSVPYTSNPSDSMFFNYSSTMSFRKPQPAVRPSLVEEPDAGSPDFVWEAEYQDKMTVLKNSISQVPSTEKRQINFHFIDDMKATFDLKSMHSKRKRVPPPKPVPTDNKVAPKKDRKGAVKLPADPTKKRRPRNAFILYRTVLQAKAEFKGKTQTELSRLIATCWAREPPETRARFERAAELEKAFGYGATDVFNIKVGPQETDWDVEADPEPETRADLDDVNSNFDPNPESDFQQHVNYPLYLPQYPNHFEQPHPDPYQVQADFQNLGSPYTDTPVYAGTPCGQINISPHQTMFPFPSIPLHLTHDQNAPMTPGDYARSPPTFYAATMEHSMSGLNHGESFALQTSAPEISDIPIDYNFDEFHVTYPQNDQHESHSTNAGYSNSVSNQESYDTYNSGNNELFSQSYHNETRHQSVENTSTSNNGLYANSHYQTSNQNPLEGYMDLSGHQMFGDASDCYHNHPVTHYQ